MIELANPSGRKDLRWAGLRCPADRIILLRVSVFRCTLNEIFTSLQSEESTVCFIVVAVAKLQVFVMCRKWWDGGWDIYLDD